MPRLLLTSCSALLVLASAAQAQIGDGYVGIYRDAAGTLPCATVPQQSGTTLYVIAKTAGASANGITGAEFRIEVSNPTGWYLSYTAPSSASLVLGNALDTSSDPNDTSGLNLSFASCVTPSGSIIPLGTISLYNASGTATNLLVKQHNRPSNGGYLCPLFTVCDAPTYSMSCMTPSTEQPCSLGKAGGVHRPAAGSVFTTTLNVTDPSESIDLAMPERQVLVMFEDGIIDLPFGHDAATYENTIISSSGVASVLAANGVEAVAKALPEPVSANAGQFRDDGMLRAADFSQLYRLVLPANADPADLAADLQGVAGVVYAHRNGRATVDDITFETADKPSDDIAGGGLPQIETSCTYSPPFALCTYTVQDCPNDPLFSDQWALVNVGQSVGGVRGNCDADIDLDEAWGLQKGTQRTVAVLGNGVYKAHPDLAGRVSGDEGVNFSTSEAGVIAANNNNGVGIVGMDWEARIVSKVIDQADDVSVVQALQAAKNAGAVVFNNSWRLWDGPPTFNNRFSQTVRIAFRDLYMDNRVTVTSMGSTGTPGGLQYPAAFGQGIISVGASTQIDLKLGNSNSGNHIDVVAPGERVRCVQDPSISLYPLATGTGISAPHVAGIASLLLAEKSYLANDDIEQIIRLSATDILPAGWDTDTGTGRINANAALALVQLPNRVYHETANGNSSTSSLGTSSRVFAVAPAVGFGPGTYLTEMIEVRRNVSFPVAFQIAPKAWGRGEATVGYNQDAPNYALGFCEAVPGTITTTGCTMRTYIYRYTDGVGTLGWFPVPAGNVQFAYTLLGQLQPVDSGEEDDVAAIGVRLSVENPIRGEGLLLVSVPQEMATTLRIYNVAGLQVATLQQGRLGAGRHEIRWSGRNGLGGHVPSGMYLARLETPLLTITRKLLVLQ